MSSSNTCQHLSKYTQSFLDEELNEREVNILKSHLKSCSACKKRYKKLKKLNKFLHAQLGEMPLGGDIVDQVKNRVSQKSTAGDAASDDSGEDHRIGGYQIIDQIGAGSMGIVYKAMQISLQRVVALKILSSRYTGKSSYIDRFIREAQAAAALQHPNIIQVFDVGQDGDTYYFSMEYVEGESVGDMLKNEGKLDINKSLDVVIQITRALSHAEKNRIVHRDIKPDNIIIDKYGVARLADLGMAKRSIEIEDKEKKSNTITRAGTIMGTPDYMSPEQASNSTGVTIQADIYSLGATFYHMITGRRPFMGTSILEVLSNVLHEPLRFHPDEDRHIPLSLQRVVRLMMAKNLDERYQSSEELLRAVLDLRNKVSTGTGDMQLDSTYLPQMRLDSAIINTKKTATIFSGQRRKKSSLFYYILGGVSLLAVMIIFLAWFLYPNPGEVKFTEAQSYREEHPREHAQYLKKLREVYEKSPESLYANKAREERERVLTSLSSELEQVSLTATGHLVKGQLDKARLAYLTFYQKYTDLKLASIANQKAGIIAREITRRFLQSMGRLRQATTLTEARRIVEAITIFANPQQIKQAFQEFENRKRELR